MRSITSDEFRAAYSATHAELLDGNSDDFHYEIEEIKLRGGGLIRPQRAGVTAIVGANNAGKSTILRELHAYLEVHPSQTQPPYLAIDSIKASGSATGHLIDWLIKNSALTADGANISFVRPSATPETLPTMSYLWANRNMPSGGIGTLRNYVCFYGNAAGRLAMGASAEKRAAVDDPPQHPVHYLEDSPALRSALSEISERVFRQPLTLDGLARVVQLRAGKVPGDPPPVDNVTREYRESLAALGALDEQGDGMRGFFGQILPVMGSTYPLILLDEPEAFLHPPQAHALGVELGRLAIERGVQILVATHDRSLLTGLLDSDGDVSVVRVTRDGGHSRVKQLDSEELRALWTDPVLRYSNVLDGLFHRTVVLAEAEGDCAFLSAGLDCSSRVADGASPLNETLFVATGGKDAMWKLATALRGVDVPVVAAPDIDLISDESSVRRLVESLGAGWSDEMHELWLRATSAQRAPRDPVKVGHVIDALTAVFAGRESDSYTSDVREELQAQARARESPWAEVKKHGVGAFEGPARVALLELLERLEDVGVVLVREGELERLAPSVGVRKGPGWLQAALAAGAQCGPLAQGHLDRILAAGDRILARE